MELEEGVKDLVHFLRSNGFDTRMSCEGGKCHPNRFPTVTIGSHLNESHALEIMSRVGRCLSEEGFKSFWISYRRNYEKGNLFSHRVIVEFPWWQSEFRRMGWPSSRPQLTLWKRVRSYLGWMLVLAVLSFTATVLTGCGGPEEVEAIVHYPHPTCIEFCGAIPLTDRGMGEWDLDADLIDWLPRCKVSDTIACDEKDINQLKQWCDDEPVESCTYGKVKI